MIHSKKETSTPTAEELIANIQKLMDEVQELVNRPSEMADRAPGHRLADLQDRLADIGDRVKGTYKTARRNIVNGAHQADEAIRAHPYHSVAVALGIGLLVGALLRRGED
jgi:ElaB/YqjD/DUF883 family membrane-anchored ribosome-binding protein